MLFIFVGFFVVVLCVCVFYRGVLRVSAMRFLQSPGSKVITLIGLEVSHQPLRSEKPTLMSFNRI